MCHITSRDVRNLCSIIYKLCDVSLCLTQPGWEQYFVIQHSMLIFASQLAAEQLFVIQHSHSNRTPHFTTWISMSRTRYKISCNIGTRRKILNAPVANHLCSTWTGLHSSPLYASLMTLCSYIIPHVILLLESAEKLSTFACPVGVKVRIHLGDCEIKDAKSESALL